MSCSVWEEKSICWERGTPIVEKRNLGGGGTNRSELRKYEWRRSYIWKSYRGQSWHLVMTYECRGRDPTVKINRFPVAHQQWICYTMCCSADRIINAMLTLTEVTVRRWYCWTGTSSPGPPTGFTIAGRQLLTLFHMYSLEVKKAFQIHLSLITQCQIV